MQGIVLNVNEAPSGDELNAAALLGATTVTLVNIQDFNSTTGQVEIGGYIYLYTSLDPTTFVMTLSPGLVTDVDAGTRINLYPYVTEKWATVELQANDDAVLALVPHSLWDRLAEGVRDPGDQEPVEIDQQAGDWIVADIVATVPLMSGEFIDPGTAPTPTDVGIALSDLLAEVAAHDTQIQDNAASIENVQETAFDAGSLASIADVRTTLSDYEPSPADAVGKADGSMWVTRTRARTNLITNPSFEVDTSHWVPYQTVMLREISAVVISGTYSAKLTNSGVSDYHLVEWDGGGGRQPVAPGQIWTASVYAAAVSGTNTRTYVQLVWYASNNSTILGYSAGAGVDLLVDDYQRLFVTGTAPASSAFVGFRVVQDPGHESAVWRIDGAMLEADDILGRYLDGRSYDGSWSGTVDLSISSLAGGKIVKVFELDNGGWTQRQYTGTSLLDIDASTITHGTMSGTLIGDGSIPIDKISGTPIVASETLLAGDLVNVYNTGGLFRMQKANAGTSLKPASGFVLAGVTNGAIGIAYSAGYNPYVTALTPGLQFLTNVGGKCDTTPPGTVGSLIQPVGFAGGATVLNFTAGQPIYIV
jgi:hypothetical protein